MGTKLGSAKRARELARLFEAWRRAFDAQDYAAMRAAKRAIDAVAAEEAPRDLDMRPVKPSDLLADDLTST